MLRARHQSTKVCYCRRRENPGVHRRIRNQPTRYVRTFALFVALLAGSPVAGSGPHLSGLAARRHGLGRASTPRDEPARDADRARRSHRADAPARAVEPHCARLRPAARRVPSPARHRLGCRHRPDAAAGRAAARARRAADQAGTRRRPAAAARRRLLSGLVRRVHRGDVLPRRPVHGRRTHVRRAGAAIARAERAVRRTALPRRQAARAAGRSVVGARIPGAEPTVRALRAAAGVRRFVPRARHARRPARARAPAHGCDRGLHRSACCRCLHDFRVCATRPPSTTTRSSRASSARTTE